MRIIALVAFFVVSSGT